MEETSGSSPPGRSSTNKCRVVIIGAGMAGLSAANHLIKNGCDDFKILEARNRIGGRIISIEMGPQKVELGANWIHGVLGNPIFELAMAHGLVNIINVPKPHKIVAATEDGSQVPFPILQEIYEAYICFLRRCEEYFLCQYIPPPDINSVGEHIDLETEMYLEGVSDPKEKRLKQMIFQCLLKRETCISGCDTMNDIDLLELGSYTELQGGNIVLPSGYSSILTPLCQALPESSIVKGCSVKAIHWKRKRTAGGLETVDEDCDSDDSDRTVTEAPVYGEDGVRIDCDDGSVYYADHVICTIPLGVLKASAKTLFDPVLPQYKTDSIDRLLFGVVDKIFLEYERPFLNADITEVMLLWPSCDESVEKTDEYLAENWFKKIYSFSKVSDTLLLGWVSGKEAEYMETLSHEVVAAKCTEILRKFLKDPYVPKPKRCVCTSWHKQPNSRGSYTAIAVGATQEDIENIAHPLYAYPRQLKPSVLFAGEHTHSNFYSTVHGAYLSGRTAAQILLTQDSQQEIIMESESSDLSSWIQGISLE